MGLQRRQVLLVVRSRLREVVRIMLVDTVMTSKQTEGTHSKNKKIIKIPVSKLFRIPFSELSLRPK